MSAVDILSETELEVRDALPDDAHAISAIYAWHVLHGRASFEEVPPTVDEMRKRMKNVIDIRWKNQSMWMPAPRAVDLARRC